MRERAKIMLFNLCPIPFQHYGNKICFNQFQSIDNEEIRDKGRDLTRSYDQQKCQKGKVTTKTTPQKSSIT